MVEEEFISHPSEALQAHNFIVQMKNNENKGNKNGNPNPRTVTEKTITRYEWEHTNPFSRKNELKGKVAPEKHKKLVL